VKYFRKDIIKVQVVGSLYIYVKDETHDLLWNGSEVDGNVKECEKDEGTDCEDGDSDTIW